MTADWLDGWRKKGGLAHWLVWLESVRDRDLLCVLTEVNGFRNFSSDYRSPQACNHFTVGRVGPSSSLLGDTVWFFP
jgi:hypothetical protein